MRVEATDEEIQAWLKPAATTSEQIRGLEALGLAPADVARACAVTVHALRGWATRRARPRPDAAIALDDLRATAKILIDHGLEPERTANWIRGWNDDLKARPLDVMRTAPTDVRTAAFGEIAEMNATRRTRAAVA